MSAKLSYKPKSKVLYRDRLHVIARPVSETQVLIKDASAGDAIVVHVSELTAAETEPERSRRLPKRSEDDKDRAEAKRRLEIIKPILDLPRGRTKVVEAAAQAVGVDVSTIFRWMKHYSEGGQLAYLLPQRKGKAMPSRLGVRMIIVDEINHVLAGKVDQRSVYLNAVKALSNELKIPIVLIGTQDALRVFQTDQQLGNRFEPFPLPRWSFNRDYATFLWSLCEGMKLKSESNFRSKQLVVRFHTMTEGLTGETYKLMTLAAEAAVRTEREIIDMELMEELPWVAPSERRRNGRFA